MATRRRTPSVLTALNTSLREAAPAKRDTATVALAKRYALELDDAAVVSRAVAKSLRKLSKIDEAAEVYEELFALATRIEEAHVAALIGPKLLAALEQLQLTPKARSVVVQGGGVGNAGPSKLDEFRTRRENRAQAVDPASS